MKDIEDEATELAEIDKLDAEIKAKQQALDEVFEDYRPSSEWDDPSYQFEADYPDEHAEINKLNAEREAKSQAFVAKHGMLPEEKKQQQEQQKK